MFKRGKKVVLEVIDDEIEFYQSQRAEYMEKVQSSTSWRNKEALIRCVNDYDMKIEVLRDLRVRLDFAL